MARDSGLGSTRRRFATGATLSAGISASSVARSLLFDILLRVIQNEDNFVVLVEAARVLGFIKVFDETHASRSLINGAKVQLCIHCAAHVHHEVNCGARIDTVLAQRIGVRGPRLSPKELIHFLRRHAAANAAVRA